MIVGSASVTTEPRTDTVTIERSLSMATLTEVKPLNLGPLSSSDQESKSRTSGNGSIKSNSATEIDLDCTDTVDKGPSGPLHTETGEAKERNRASICDGSKRSGAKTQPTVGTSSQKKDSSDGDFSIGTSMEWMASYFKDRPGDSLVYQLPIGQKGSLSRNQFEHGDTDDDSVAAHFEKTDFLPSNWNGASEYIPPIGFAVVAGGLCVMNPIVFVGGALAACTAVGAVHAAQNTYDACIEGNWCAPATTVKAEEEPTSSYDECDADKSLKEDLSDVTFSASSTHERIQSEEIPESLTYMNEQDLSAFESTEKALEWVNEIYPQLKCKSANGLEFKGLNAQEFFDVFFADDAPYTFSEFQKKRKDRKVRYGQWEELEGVTQMSLVDARAIKGPVNTSLNPNYHFRERVLNFDAKTNNGLLGPPYAVTTKVQRCLIASKKLLVLEGKSTVKDIPFCDRFYVLERWVLTTEKTADQYVSHLDVTCEVVFSKSCPFETIITSKSQEAVREIAIHWYEMAQTALKKTEHARLLRLAEEKKRELEERARESKEAEVRIPAAEDDKIVKHNDENESIELERMGHSLTRIIAETGFEEISSSSSSMSGSSFAKNSSSSWHAKAPTGRSRRRASLGKSLGKTLTSLVRRQNQSSPDLMQLS